MMSYKPLPVVVKFVRPGYFRDTLYKSFRTMDDARKFIKKPYFRVPKEVYLTKYAVFVQIPIDDIIGWDQETGEVT
jgi:hypothetical protein